jgi:enamine deaminase RidA (YjgF/YER057c/UK114 family)
VADEYFVLCRPDGEVAGAIRQAETAYEVLLDTLAAEGVGPEALVTETVFVRRTEDVGAVRFARSRALGGDGTAATTFIGQAPLEQAAHVELSTVAVVPRPGVAASAYEVSRAVVCPCGACTPGVRATVARRGDRTHLYAANIHGSGRNAFEEACDMFRIAQELLAEATMRFGDVIRTWIYVRDIDRDYDALNQARRAFFRRCGVERPPASTGVQGIPIASSHDFSMSLYAVASPRPLVVTPMSTPYLNEPSSYGAEFSRGLRLVEGDTATLYVSGTASIDEMGRTAHVGDFRAQVHRMLDNVESLLAREGGTFGHLVSGVAYLRRAADEPVLRAICRQRGFVGFPCALVEASLCRPELLCEVEAVATVPLAPAVA